MDAYRFQSAFIQHLFGRSPCTFVMHFSFTYQAQRYMRQLNQVTTGSHTTMFRNKRTYTAVDELCQQCHQFRMNTTLALRERAHARKHRRAYENIIQRFTGSSRMRADDVILQFTQMTILNAPLSHRTEPRIDAINDLIARETRQEIIGIGDALKRRLIP